MIIQPRTLMIYLGTRMTEIATFAAGCFWSVEASFRKVKGVLDTKVGYSGGKTAGPTYEDVCTDRTGHAESVLVEFNPAVVSYDDLLEVFWRMHDPTTMNRQGPDVGSQYRSVIFYHTPDQREKALRSKENQAKKGILGWRQIVTEIVPAAAFYPAEEYHQRYHEKHGPKACGICSR
jgi:peptide-methionine (S)-S-oxide reductase